MTEVLTEVFVATKNQKLQRKTTFSERNNTKSPENTPFHTADYFALIREGGRTVGSGRVASIIE